MHAGSKTKHMKHIPQADDKRCNNKEVALQFAPSINWKKVQVQVLNHPLISAAPRSSTCSPRGPPRCSASSAAAEAARRTASAWRTTTAEKAARRRPTRRHPTVLRLNSWLDYLVPTPDPNNISYRRRQESKTLHARAPSNRKFLF